MISEFGLYKLVMWSNKSDAKLFQDWGTKVVLPAIRKDGGYMVAKADETPAEIMARAVLLAQDTIKQRDERIAVLEMKVVEDVPKLATHERTMSFSALFDV
jgi:prophage antirepressor-like protein